MPSTVYPDCDVAVKSLNNHRKSKKPTRARIRDANIPSIAASHLQAQNSTVMRVKGHPERTAPDAESWIKEMWGNHHLSDRNAAEAFYYPTKYQYDGIYDNLISIRCLFNLSSAGSSESLVLWILHRSVNVQIAY